MTRGSGLFSSPHLTSDSRCILFTSSEDASEVLRPLSFVVTVIPAFLGMICIGLTHGLSMMGYMIAALSHLRISSLTASNTLGFSHLCASLEGQEYSSRKMRRVHAEGSIPLRSDKFHPIASFLPRKTANNLSSWS